jgi:hypothetical protein
MQAADEQGGARAQLQEGDARLAAALVSRGRARAGAQAIGLARGLEPRDYRYGARNPSVACTPRLPGGGRRALPRLRSSGAGRQAGRVWQERGPGGLAGLTWLRGAARGVPALPCTARLGHT